MYCPFFLRPQSERVPTTAAAMIVISENDATGGSFCFVLFESKRSKLLQARGQGTVDSALALSPFSNLRCYEPEEELRENCRGQN